LATIAISSKEFGETYHLALALGMDKSVSAALIGPDIDAQHEFLGLFAEQARIATYKGCSSAFAKANRSTDFYSCRWSLEAISKAKDAVLQATYDRRGDVALFLDKRLQRKPERVVLVWIRNRSDYAPCRNSTVESTHQLLCCVHRMGWRAVLIGNSIDGLEAGDGNLLDFYAAPPFDAVDRIALQLRMFHELQTKWALVTSVGMVSGGMDGPALFLGLPTLSLCSKCNEERLKKISRIAPRYRMSKIANERGSFIRYADSELQTVSNVLREIASPTTE
jgi:hypothetical protein